MLTNDKTITTADYWDRVYNGGNMNARVDASNTQRTPVKAGTSTIDRFNVVAELADGPRILDIASGHAHICKRIKAKHPDWSVTASDQSKEARLVAKYSPYLLINAYNIPFPDKTVDTVICTQAMEYMEDQERFILEARRVGRKLLITVPNGEMSNWSQLRIYNSENLPQLLLQYGDIEVFNIYDHMILAKLKFK